MPYLYHSGEYHPGMFTLETTRGAAGTMSSLANLLLLGKDGFRALLGHAVEMAEWLREQVAARPELTVVNEENFGPVTLFRAYPDGVDTFSIRDQELHDPDRAEQIAKHNDLNRRIYGLVHREALSGKGVAIGFTENYRHTASGIPLVALKSYVLSPFADKDRMETIIDHVLAARRAVLSGQA
jgi:glutamate/tyrosine decarboxylase-like PLP-dependent enzyme